MRRAFKTAYYLNRALPRLALLGRGVRAPNTHGVWVPVADGGKKRCEVVRMLSLAHPSIEPEGLPYAALLTDFDVEQFETHVCPAHRESTGSHDETRANGSGVLESSSPRVATIIPLRRTR